MSTSFAEARRIVEEDLRPAWRRSDGTLITMPDGFEDKTHWQVRAGAREWLVDRNGDFVTFDAPAYLVSKETGKLEKVDVLPNLERLNKMTPVSA